LPNPGAPLLGLVHFHLPADGWIALQILPVAR